ncbi:LuxR C-terminal-related transcriptional regulator [Streptomyces sp. NPDC019443]|uniref:LuxR C-terminal-related transcriptional regulator n=1 Tax=Streptomyces sp. NPDC019443 TaxID=3365061 RepID=UPI0037AEE369
MLPLQEHERADVVVMLTVDVTDETMLLMEAVSARSVKPGMGIVLVTGSVREGQVVRAVQFGLRSVIWRQDAGFDRIAKAIRGVADGRGVLPASVQGWLINHIGTVHSDVLGPMGLTPSGLEVREVEVLRLLADGLDTTEIAQKLSYSERTIKNIISGMINRLGLRNRTHAVAFALRSGTL